MAPRTKPKLKSTLSKIQDNISFQKGLSSEEETTTMVDESETMNTKDEKPVEIIEVPKEPVVNTVVEEKSEVELHNTSLPVNKPVDTFTGITEDNSNKTEQGGLKGNPGQLQRFNRLMEGKSENINKYFWSGRKH